MDESDTSEFDSTAGFRHENDLVRHGSIINFSSREKTGPKELGSFLVVYASMVS